MIVEFHGMKCRYGTYRLCGENRPVLTLLNNSDWQKSLQYGFSDPQNGLWYHFLTEEEMRELFDITEEEIKELFPK